MLTDIIIPYFTLIVNNIFEIFSLFFTNPNFSLQKMNYVV